MPDQQIDAARWRTIMLLLPDKQAELIEMMVDRLREQIGREFKQRDDVRLH